MNVRRYGRRTERVDGALLCGAPLSKDARLRLVSRRRDEFAAWGQRDVDAEDRYLLLGCLVSAHHHELWPDQRTLLIGCVGLGLCPRRQFLSGQMLRIGRMVNPSGGAMQLVERFYAEASDGRIVEILQWSSKSVTHGDGGARGQTHTIYATVEGWRCHPAPDGGYTVNPSGVSVWRIG